MSLRKQAICPTCGQNVGVYLGVSGYRFKSHKDRNGDACSGSGWKMPKYPIRDEFIARELVCIAKEFLSESKPDVEVYGSRGGSWRVVYAGKNYGTYDFKSEAMRVARSVARENETGIEVFS